MFDILIALYLIMAGICIAAAMQYLHHNRSFGFWLTPVAVVSGLIWPLGIYGHFRNRRIARIFELTCMTGRISGWYRYRHVTIGSDGLVRPLVDGIAPIPVPGDTVYVAVYTHRGVEYRKDTECLIRIPEMPVCDELDVQIALRRLPRRWRWHFRTGL